MGLGVGVRARQGDRASRTRSVSRLDSAVVESYPSQARRRHIEGSVTINRAAHMLLHRFNIMSIIGHFYPSGPGRRSPGTGSLASGGILGDRLTQNPGEERECRMRFRTWLYAMTMVVTAAVTAWAPACGEDDSCPGVICTNCSASGDCPNLECSDDQSLFCVAFPFGDLDSSERCTFCESPDFQLP